MHQKERMPETMFCHIEEDMGMGTHVRVLSRAKGYLEESVGILGNAKIAETALRLPCKYMGSVEYVIVFFDGGGYTKQRLTGENILVSSGMQCYWKPCSGT